MSMFKLSSVLKTRRFRLAAIVSVSAIVVTATVMLIMEIREYQAGRYGTNEGYFAQIRYLPEKGRSSEASLPCEKIVSSPIYVASGENGRIVVRDRSGGTVVKLDTLYYMLTDRDRACLDGGVELYGEEALDSFICDYTG